jgi:Lon protease-like protein
MYNLEDVTKLPDDFDGQVRLFPLPNLVVFPHAMQPLHLFEPRYVQMLKDSMVNDRLIAMATLTPLEGTNWPTKQPPIAPTVCVGRILTHSEIEDDRHNILLVGIRRAKLVAEIDAGKPYRLGQVEMIEDYELEGSQAEGRRLKKLLLEAFGAVMPVGKTMQQNLHQLMADQMSLGPITDIVGYTLPFSVEDKLKLLREGDVSTRARFLISQLNSGAIQFKSNDEDDRNAGGQAFPPHFSAN